MTLLSSVIASVPVAVGGYAFVSCSQREGGIRHALFSAHTWAVMAVTAWLSVGLAIGVFWAYATNITWWFCAFLVPGWPLWLIATTTDSLWLVSWLPDIFWQTY